MKTWFSVLALVLLCGCAGGPQPHQYASEQVQQMSKVEYDDFTKLTHVNSPIILDNANWAAQTSWQLRAHQKANEEPQYFIRIACEAAPSVSWAFFESAFDREGTKHDLVRAKSEVSNQAWVYEVYVCPITREYIEKLSNAPMDWKCFGRRTYTFTIHTNVVAGFIAKVDATFSKKL